MRKARKESEWSQATRGATNYERKQILDYIEHQLDEGSTIEEILDEVRRGKHRRSDTREAVQAARRKKYPKKRPKKSA